jgi:hypothetical protein
MPATCELREASWSAPALWRFPSAMRRTMFKMSSVQLRKLSGFDATEMDSLAPARSVLAGLCPALRDKFLSLVGFIVPAQLA